MTLPVVAILDLWSLGHSGLDIAARLGLTSREAVANTVAKARAIGDPRAVIHVTAAHKPIGNVRRAKSLLVRRPDLEVVPMPRRKRHKPVTHCRAGHEFTEANTGLDPIPGGGWRRRCRACGRNRKARA